MQFDIPKKKKSPPAISVLCYIHDVHRSGCNKNKQTNKSSRPSCFFFLFLTHRTRITTHQPRPAPHAYLKSIIFDQPYKSPPNPAASTTSSSPFPSPSSICITLPSNSLLHTSIASCPTTRIPRWRLPHCRIPRCRTSLWRCRLPVYLRSRSLR